MKNPLILFLLICIASCTNNELKPKDGVIKMKLNLAQANRLAKLPCKCLLQEYPNKLGQVLNDSSGLQSPKELHPIFYGCFDWHSSVHGHWMLIHLLKEFPNLENKDSLILLLDKQFDAEKISQEIAFFKTKYNESFERTYGWAWIFKLQEELNTWKNPLGQKWAQILLPLTQELENKCISFLPKLVYPIRTGEHPNTAFTLSFAYDYALQSKNIPFQKSIKEAANRFYGKDVNYSFAYEPSGYDFLSPGLEEIDVMRKVLPKEEFMAWIEEFHSQLVLKSFDLELGKIKDRTDGKLVHLDGLNFSRAWCLKALADSDEKFAHLKNLANKHISYSLKNIIDGDYMGEHWLASFACFAMKE